MLTPEHLPKLLQGTCEHHIRTTEHKKEGEVWSDESVFFFFTWGVGWGGTRKVRWLRQCDALGDDLLLMFSDTFSR